MLCFVKSNINNNNYYVQVAIPDVTEAVKGAKILVFVIPHQFIAKLCDQIKPHITEGTIGISLIKVRPSRWSLAAALVAA